MKSIFTSFVNQPNSKSTDPSDCFLGRSIPSYVVFIAVFLTYYIVFQSFYNFIESKDPWPYYNFTDFVISTIVNMVPTLITFGYNYAIVFHTNQRLSPVKKLAADFFCSMLSLVALNFLFIGVMLIVNPEYSHVSWPGAIFNNLFILAGSDIYYFTSRYIAQIKETADARQQVLKYRYDSLRSQMNPHFLFNTLNILYAMEGKDTEASKKVILKVSSMFRYILEHHEQTRMPLFEELQFVEQYMYILTIRYSHHLHVIYIGEPPSEKSIVPFSLQLLLENVVKHNTITSEKSMTVTIAFLSDGFCVSNPIQPRPVGQSTQIGISYLKNLYRHYHKEVLVKNDSHKFEVFIPYLPA